MARNFLLDTVVPVVEDAGVAVVQNLFSHLVASCLFGLDKDLYPLSTRVIWVYEYLGWDFVTA
jgi:hypothetical protein